jgi:hypothetical protein
LYFHPIIRRANYYLGHLFRRTRPHHRGWDNMVRRVICFDGTEIVEWVAWNRNRASGKSRENARLERSGGAVTHGSGYDYREKEKGQESEKE